MDVDAARAVAAVDGPVGRVVETEAVAHAVITATHRGDSGVDPRLAVPRSAVPRSVASRAEVTHGRSLSAAP